MKFVKGWWPSVNVTPRWTSIVSALAAVVWAGVAALALSNVSVIWDSAHYGDYGITLTDNTTVADVVGGSPADRAGIKRGDGVQRPPMLRDRLILTGTAYAQPGERMSITVMRAHDRRTIALQAQPLAPIPAAYRFGLLLSYGVSLVFLALGLGLVLLRPTKATWGFFLVASGLVSFTNQFHYGSTSTSWLLALALSIGAQEPAAVAGFCLFCVNFPTNAPTGWLRVIDRITPFLFVWQIALNIFVTLCAVDFAPGLLLAGLGHFVNWSGLGFVALGTGALLSTYFRAGELDRHRIRWVVLGLICTSIAIAIEFFYVEGSVALPLWEVSILSLLYLVLPLAVFYAVVRHRVIDIRFILSRSLLVGVLAAIVALIIVGVDWLFSTRLPASRLETATYFAIALLIGLSLNSGRQRISKIVDALFFRQWHRSQEQAGAIADVIRRATLRTDLYEPLTAGIRSAFSLTSVGLFERVEDGGFVRVAASGWPAGTIWHICQTIRLSSAQIVVYVLLI